MSDREIRPNQLEQAGASDDAIQDVHAALLREKPEPSEGTVPVPLLLLALIGGLVFFSGVYLGRFSGGFDSMVYNEEAGDASGSVAAAPVDPVAMGKRLFTANCATCHQITGLGVPGTYPPLAGSEWVQGNEEAIVRILLHGLRGPVTVKGNTFNGQMPSFGPLGLTNWNDEKIAWALTYVRQEWGNTAPAVTKETVARIRKVIADHKTDWVADDLTPYRVPVAVPAPAATPPPAAAPAAPVPAPAK